MSHAEDMQHPLYRINMLMPGQSRIDRTRSRVFLRTLKEPVHGSIMQEYVTVDGMLRTTLNNEVLDWLRAEQTDQMSILAGYGLTWVEMWSLRDATLFKMFYL